MKIKTGLHLLNTTDLNTITSLAGRLYRAGHAIPLFVVVNRRDIVQALKQVSPSSITVDRLERGVNPDLGGNPYQSGYDYFNTWWNHSPGTFWQGANEWCNTGTRGAQADWYRGFMQAANEVGTRVTFGDYSVGSIEPNEVPLLQDMLEMGYIFGHALNYHMYGDPANPGNQGSNAQYYDLRWVDWIKPFPNLLVLGGEEGTFDPTYRGVDQLIANMKQDDQLLTPYNAYAARWSWGYWNIDQGKSDIESAQAAIEAYYMAGDVSPVTIPDPDPDLGLRTLIAAIPEILDSEQFVIQRFPLQQYPDLAQEVITTGARLKPMLTYINTVLPPVPPTPPSYLTYKVTTLGDGLHVRDKPTTIGSHVIRSLSQGTTVQVVPKSDTQANNYNWVQLADGNWSASEYLPDLSLYLIQA